MSSQALYLQSSGAEKELYASLVARGAALNAASVASCDFSSYLKEATKFLVTFSPAKLGPNEMMSRFWSVRRSRFTRIG